MKFLYISLLIYIKIFYFMLYIMYFLDTINEIDFFKIKDFIYFKRILNKLYIKTYENITLISYLI